MPGPSAPPAGEGPGSPSRRARLLAVLAVTIAILVAEVAGGLLSHALVLFADAGHMAADSGGILLALVAIGFAARRPDASRTFGYQRAEILFALLNALLLLGVSGLILFGAAEHLLHPSPVDPTLVAIFGGGAFLGNGLSLLILGRGQKSLNLRMVSLEVLADLLGAALVLLSAAVVAATGFQRTDAVAAVLISFLIVARTVRLLRDAVDVLLETVPRGVDLAAVRRHLRTTPGVMDVHDLHAWAVTSGVPVLSAHVVVAEQVLADGGGARVLDQLTECLRGHFDVEHCTFQLEPASHRGHEAGLHA